MDKSKIYHFTGIKGSGMSALALVLHGEGYKVQGSDLEQYFFTQKGLEEAGITLLPFSADNIKEGQVVIAGNAFPDSHKELVSAREKGVEVIQLPQILRRIVKRI